LLKNINDFLRLFNTSFQKKRKKSRFLNMKKRKIRNLEHCGRVQLVGSLPVRTNSYNMVSISNIFVLKITFVLISILFYSPKYSCFFLFWFTSNFRSCIYLLSIWNIRL